jgi:hypothetical protein
LFTQMGVCHDLGSNFILISGVPGRHGFLLVYACEIIQKDLVARFALWSSSNMWRRRLMFGIMQCYYRRCGSHGTTQLCSAGSKTVSAASNSSVY